MIVMTKFKVNAMEKIQDSDVLAAVLSWERNHSGALNTTYSSASASTAKEPNISSSEQSQVTH